MTDTISAGSLDTTGHRTDETDAAIVLSACAALVHIVVIPEHWAEWRAAAVFFGVAALGQAALAVALLLRRAGPRTLLAGVWANVAVIITWVISRTAGLPFGPAESVHSRHPGASHFPTSSIEAIGWLDLVALAAELLCIVLLLGMMSNRHRRLTSTGLLVAGASLWGLAAFGVLS